jgi:uncharacterized protein (TIGR04255 family)
MSEFEQLSNAPVQEGLIDLRVVLSSPPTLESLAGLVAELAECYPEAVPIHRTEIKLDLSETNASSQSDSSFMGMRLTSVDKTVVFQAQADGFTVSRLRPYSSWPDLIGEAKSLWLVYKKHLAPVSIDRVAVRYINRLEFPQQVADFAEYLTAPPVVPVALPQSLSNYYIRLQIPHPDSGAMIVLSQALEEVTESIASVILDIDVFKLVSLDSESMEMWETLEKLRQVKNLAFFGSVTEKMIARLR